MGERGDKVELFGHPIDNLTMAETLDRIQSFVEAGGTHQHVVVNVDKVVKAHKDPELARIINSCDLINADGMPIVWASRLLGKPLKERVAGIDLFEAILRDSGRRGWRIYLLGAKEPVVRNLREILINRYKDIKICGFRNGYWTDAEEPAIVDEIVASKPDVLFVAMSSPKKEQFIARHKEKMTIPFIMGVGGSFDVVAGRTKRAPIWMQKWGMEWFYRFLQEPRRMFRRYFVEDIMFIFIFVAQYLKNRKNQ